MTTAFKNIKSPPATSWRSHEDSFDPDVDEEDEDTTDVFDVAGEWVIQCPVLAETFGVDPPFRLRLMTSIPKPGSFTLWAFFDLVAFQGTMKFVDNQRPKHPVMPFEWRGTETISRQLVPIEGLKGWVEFVDDDELKGYIEGPPLGRFAFEGRKVQGIGSGTMEHQLMLEKWEQMKPSLEDVLSSLSV